jgi:hypothetical protein
MGMRRSTHVRPPACAQPAANQKARKRRKSRGREKQKTLEVGTTAAPGPANSKSFFFTTSLYSKSTDSPCKNSFWRKSFLKSFLPRETANPSPALPHRVKGV